MTPIETRCSACPDRNKLSCIAAKLILGPNYQTENCDGPILDKVNAVVGSNADGSSTAAYLEETYLCGQEVDTNNHKVTRMVNGSISLANLGQKDWT